MGREEKSKKRKKEKKDKREKRRRKESSDESSSGSDAEASKRTKSEKLARKVVAHLQRTGGGGANAPFVWGKKVEKELGEGKKLKDISIFSDRNRQQERLDELEKVRKRQLEREEEKERREEELVMVQRMRGAQEAMDSAAKEDEFYLQSLLAKAERRLRENRPTASDLIARNLHVGLRLGEPADFNMKDPWTYFTGLQLDDVEALHSDVFDYQEYDKYDSLHLEFWKALLEVADYELREAKKRDEIDRAHLKGGAEAAAAVIAAGSENTLHPDVERDIMNMLHGQTYGELMSLDTTVKVALERGEGDGTYWQAVQTRLRIQMAKAHVREVMARIVGAELQRLAQEAAEAAEEMGLSSSEEESEGEEERGGQAGFGAGTAVAKAMGWAKEKRGGARAAGEGPVNPEDIDIDEEGEEGQQGPGTGGVEGEEGAGGAGAGGAMGPQPAQVTFPKEVPGWGRRRPRRKQGGEGEATLDDAQRVGGEQAEGLPEEAPADGTMSPLPLSPSRIKMSEEVVGEEDDYRELELMRQQAKLQTSLRFRAVHANAGEESGPSTVDQSVRALLRDSGRVGVHPMFRHIAAVDPEGGFRAGIPDKLSADDETTLAQFKQASLKAMGDGGADRDFGGEVPLEAQVYWWHDKHKPRKPKYFNRVHTGYEWSKYNQTHYDYDNPPPKVVQGYKFNILYHDLIDKSKAPYYVVERDPQSTDNSTCFIRFIAGPPYEDIAFRVVNKEWNYARKHGFRCAYERGILHLFFNLKRTRYRR